MNLIEDVDMGHRITAPWLYRRLYIATHWASNYISITVLAAYTSSMMLQMTTRWAASRRR
jgi:hypothetical protein